MEAVDLQPDPTVTAHPTVSVVIPTYNRASVVLDRAVQSVLNQSTPPTEIVIVNDNPPDSSAQDDIGHYAVRMLLSTDHGGTTGIVYLAHVRGQGASRARNHGVEAASGTYVAFLDDDDVYHPRKLERQLAFTRNGAFDMSFHDVEVLNADGEVIDYRTFDPPANSDDDLLRYHLTRHLTGTSTFLYRRAAFLEVGGFPVVRVGQEFSLMLATIEQGMRIGYFPACEATMNVIDGGRISTGANKIRGEQQLFDLKKRYFPMLSTRERMFIRFRHYAVLGVAHARNREPLAAGRDVVLAVLSSPLDLLLEGAGFATRVRSRRTRRVALHVPGRGPAAGLGRPR